MMRSRRAVLAVLLGGVVLLTTGILRGLLVTIFFAVTVAYVLVPLTTWFERRGLPEWWAAAAATLAAFLAGVAVFLPIAAVLYLRRGAVLALLRSLPDSVTLSAGEFEYVVAAGDVTAFVSARLSGLALTIARETPVLAAKLVVFAFVVFALLYRGDRLRRALLAPVPVAYHDIAATLHGRLRETLFSLYVIQAMTSVGTFLVALAVFAALGYRFPVTLAVTAGVLQFLPVVGPSLLIAALAVAEVVAGDPAGAAVVAVVGLVFVGALPDAVIRPRLARERTQLPASLYFVGFTGGLLSLGPVGIIAGPVVVAMLVAVLELLADEINPTRLETFGT